MSRHDNLDVLVEPSCVRPSRVYLSVRKTTWHSPIAITLRPGQARRIAAELLRVQREMERAKKARWRAAHGK